MSRIKILVFSLLGINLSILGASNFCINTDLMKNQVEVKITDKLNKLSLEFENNKFLGINNINLEKNNVKINKFNLFENKDLYVDKTERYYLTFNHYNLSISQSVSGLNNDGIDLMSINYKKNNLELSTLFFNAKNKDFDSFYFDFTSLLYTKRGLVNYIFLNHNNFTIENEVALGKYGVFSSSTATLELSKVKLFFNFKNLDEKYRVGFVFNSENINIKVTDKIYQISAYGGQGKKRNFTINSNLKFDFERKRYHSTLYFTLQHEVDYDVYLKKRIIQKYKVRKKIETKNKKIELCCSYDEEFSFYLIVDCFKISFKRDKIDLQLLYRIQKTNNSFTLQASTSGVLKFSYCYCL